MSVLVALQRRQFHQVERWDHKLLYNYCEHNTVRRLNNRASWQEVVNGRRSTMIIAFSSNGEFMASGHLTHEIIVHRMTPRIHYLQTLSGHSRTPWCLAFDPVYSNILYSGCLAGTVHKWDVQTGKSFDATFNPGRHSPINNIVFVPSDPSLILVALECWLYMLTASDFQVLWCAQTESVATKVRLVLHHPEDCRILTAVMNPSTSIPDHPQHIRTAMALHTTYRLQIYGLHRTSPPDLEDNSSGLVCLSARIVGPHSCVMTTDQIICTRINDQGHTEVSIYSIQPKNFGACLCSVPLDQGTNVVSLDVSPCGAHLLLGLSTKRNIFHMNRSISATALAVIFQISEADASKQIKLKEVCTVRSNRGDSSNIALWIPLVCGHGVCLCVGTQKGSVLCSHLNSRTTKHKISSANNSFTLCEFVLPNCYPPEVPIPPIQMRPL